MKDNLCAGPTFSVIVLTMVRSGMTEEHASFYQGSDWPRSLHHRCRHRCCSKRMAGDIHYEAIFIRVPAKLSALIEPIIRHVLHL